MKKFIYILSLTVGFALTGCTQWEEGAPLQWGNGDLVIPPELTIEAPDRITSDVLSFTAKVKNAKIMAYIVTEGSKANEIDYYNLIYGYVPGVVKTPITTESFEHTFDVGGAVVGKTYTLHVAAVDNHDLMVTYKKNITAIDGVLPYMTSNAELTATHNGTRASITFNEPIVRNNNMGAITYNVYNNRLEVIQSGTATATASGNILTVSLPAPVSFDEVVYVLLSFEEGAVEDAHGNKMTAANNILDENGRPTGPWWCYEGFFRNGHNYAFAGKIDIVSGTQQQFGSTAKPLTHVADNVTIDGVTTRAWTMPSILDAFSSDIVTANQAVPAYTYTATVDGKSRGFITFYDINNQLPLLGTVMLSGVEHEVYAADYDMQAGKVYAGWSFAISDNLYQGQSYYICEYTGTQPVIIAIDNDSKEIIVVADIDPETFLFQDGDFITRSYMANMPSTPVVLKNVKLEVNRNKIFRYTY